MPRPIRFDIDWSILKSAGIARFLLAFVFAAGLAQDANAQALRASPSNDQAQIKLGQELLRNYQSGKLSQSDAQQFEAAVKRGKQAARSSVPGSLAGGNVSGSCKCTAFCQTIVFMNGTEYQTTGTGTVSSPSACADAAVAFCGSAYSTWLSGWTCK
jgi:hypothetical protein